MEFTDINTLVSFVNGRKLPEWQRKLFAKNREAVQVHSKGRLFYKLDRLFPNEHPSSKGHRLLSFEPVTESSFLKGRNNVGRIFKNSSYTAEASEATVDYITGNNFCDKNLFTFLLDLFVETTLSDDPNAPIVVYPPDFMEDKDFEQIITVSTEHVVHWDHNSLVFKSVDESVVEKTIEYRQFCNDFEYSDQVDKLGLKDAYKETYSQKINITFKRTVYHAFVDDKFFRIAQTENGLQFEVEEYQLPNTDYPPCVAGGGIKDEDPTVFKSFLYPFVPFGNLALLQHSQHTAVNFTFSFPRMSELESPCTATGCNEGKILLTSPSEIYPDGIKDCVRCKGTGFTSSQSPYKIYKRKFDPAAVDPDTAAAILNAKDVEFYTPDVGILGYSKKEWKDYLDLAEQAIFVPQKAETGNVESFKSKEKDLDQMYAWLMTVSERFYYVLRFVIQQIENYTVANPVDVSVNQPYSFAILSEYEAFEVLDFKLKSNAPDFIKGSEIQSFVSRFLSASSPVRKLYDVLSDVDMLLLQTTSDITTFKSNNIVTPEQWSIHVYAYPVLKKMYNQDKTLFNEDISVISGKLIKELAQFKPPASDLKTNLLKANEAA